ncbi:hypothetical protein PsalN5692_04102 (plasmid) [Piscirickettsia salmonis]|uniref:type II toxin-antitoxin system HicB family antitoxin n=1 Tax=Piscirickettsia salmonis TaxID=1238 RepID=UPI0012B7A5D2|nr:type II toxin-antitoxin system HicB family antitoxin [Piscirickettsia salmonis]QGP52593.1 hypothetical protein PsalN5692_04102 [Piscirickettsia salmonis]
MLKYKGYIGKVEEIHEGDEYIYGVVPNIKDIISFRGKNIKELTKDFKLAIDDYLALCDERGEEADKPFSGRFMTRLGSDLHEEVFLASMNDSEVKSMNDWVVSACLEKLKHDQAVKR